MKKEASRLTWLQKELLVLCVINKLLLSVYSVRAKRTVTNTPNQLPMQSRTGGSQGRPKKVQISNKRTEGRAERGDPWNLSVSLWLDLHVALAWGVLRPFPGFELECPLLQS